MHAGAVRDQLRHLSHRGLDLGRVHIAGAVGIHLDRQMLEYPDSIVQFLSTTVGQVARRAGGRAVDIGRV